MNPIQLSPILILMLLTGCDTNTSGSQRASKETESGTECALTKVTHLHDTATVSGSFILFLRPDDRRLKSYGQDESPGIYEVDSDFGLAIHKTLNELAKNRQFQGIQGLVSTKRYLRIGDCATCPVVIDRDTIDYGVIFSAKGQKIETTYGFEHGGDYLLEIKEYFHTR